MHVFTCIFLVAIFCQYSGTSNATLDTVPFKKNETLESISSASTENSAELKGEKNLKEVLKPTNLILDLNLTTSQTQPQFKSEVVRKRRVENKTLSNIKPFLFFPILPFLFPKDNDKSFADPVKNEVDREKNHILGENNDVKEKPFIFIDFAFNIRQIPLKNRTDLLGDPKIKEPKTLAFDGPPFGNPIKNVQQGRRRRNLGVSRKKSNIFDDSSLFPESETEEFFPKNDLFFPGFSFLSNAHKKLGRRKRGMKKSNGKPDLKFFMDAFDEAFISTKRELERTDPILNFLEGGKRPFDEYKKGMDDFLELQEKPNMEWRIQRNAGNVNDEQQNARKAQDTPMIIMDKVVKIGEFHVHNDNQDMHKAKAKKKAAHDALLKLLVGDDYGERSVRKAQDKKATESKHVLELFTQRQGKEDNNKKKIAEPSDVGKTFAKVESKEIRVLPGIKTSVLVVGGNASIELKNKEPFAGNFSDKVDLLDLKVGDSAGSEVEGKQANAAKRLRRRSNEKVALKSPPYDDLKKNITAVVTKFLALAEDDKSVDGEGAKKRENEDFNWSEKETLENEEGQNEPENKNDGKELDFEEHYVDSNLESKDRQIADLSYLFVSVTLPTVCTFTLLLLVCFFFLRVKGKFCTKVFEPRKVYLIEEPTGSHSSLPTKKESLTLEQSREGRRGSKLRDDRRVSKSRERRVSKSRERRVSRSQSRRVSKSSEGRRDSKSRDKTQGK